MLKNLALVWARNAMVRACVRMSKVDKRMRSEEEFGFRVQDIVP